MQLIRLLSLSLLLQLILQLVLLLLLLLLLLCQGATKLTIPHMHMASMMRASAGVQCMVTAAWKHTHATQSRQQQADCVHIPHHMLSMASPGRWQLFPF